jgi:TatD DNase family protein
MNFCYIDTHAHPAMIRMFEKEKNNRLITDQDIIDDAKQQGIKKIFCIATEIHEFASLQALARQHPEYYFSIGTHPCDIIQGYDKNILINTVSDALASKDKIIGIGETGIDLYHNNSYNILEAQTKIFKDHIEVAKLYNLPLIIHTRNATEITYALLKEYKNQVRGVIHAFCDGPEWAQKFVDLGFYLGIGGVTTYPKNNHIREAIKQVGMEHIVFETDSPFLPIQTMRGKINYPSYIHDISLYISNFLDKDPLHLADTVYQNTQRLFFY